MFSLRVGLDLGSANVRLNLDGKIAVDEPSLLVVNCNSREVRLIGQKALEVRGKSIPGFEALYPFEGGRVVNLAAAEALLRYVIKKASRFRRCRLRFALPSAAGSVDRICLERAAQLAGAASVEFVSSPLAAAIGAGIDMTLPGGILIIDIGEYKTEIAVLSAGDIIDSETSAAAGREFDSSIARAVRGACKMSVMPLTVEKLKCEIASAVPLNSPKSMKVSGLDLVSGSPCEHEISSELVSAALADPLNEIVRSAAELLWRIPCELSADLCENGAVLVGGGAKLFGIGQYLQEHLGIPVKVADSPEYCVALGCSSVAPVKVDRAGEERRG
ncbi:rod shape-determining protein [bacterium]|nr:rod shape-determining protein [bacterium]